MIIREIHLHPFAGLTDKAISLDTGLNVILGPNEAGKSTIVDALRLALFTSTDYGAREWDRTVSRFVPITGGDTICVDLTLGNGAETHRLHKSWGGTNESSLTLPGGEVLTDPARVDEALGGLLRWGAATYNAVLLSRQSILGDTLSALYEEAEPMRDLGAVLRSAVFETDGVPIEELGALIGQEHDDYTGRWDTDLQRPEGNRGIENRWQRSVGYVLEAYYEREETVRALAEAEAYERTLDELNERVRGLEADVQGLNAQIAEAAPVVEDARNRGLLEVRVQNLRGEEQRLREVAQAWPRAEERAGTLDREVAALHEKRDGLQTNLDGAQAYDEHRGRLDTFRRAQGPHTELDRAQEALDGMAVIDPDDLAALERLEAELTRLETSLAAGRISLRLTVQREMDLRVKRDLEDEVEQRVQPDAPLELSVGGGAQLTHSDWALDIKSGEMDFETLQEDHRETASKREQCLSRLGVADLSAARSLAEARADQVREVERLKDTLETILDGETYEDLKAFHDARGDVPEPSASAADIARQLGEVSGELRDAERERDENRQRLDEWTEAHGSQEALLDLLVEKRGEVNAAEGELTGLRPLPEGVTDAQTFIDEFDRRRQERDERQAALSQFRIEQAGLQGGAPEETVEDLRLRLQDAERQFEQVQREAAAIAVIDRTYDEVRSAMDAQTLDPWVDELRRVLAPLTGGRYRQLTTDDLTDGRAIRADGTEIPYDLLSVGTRVGLGLAIRLSMARHFLKDTDGFLVLDDPLVDLDPERRGQAAAVVSEFARDKQVVVITCHPHHAEALGGNLIDLPMPS